MFCKKCVFKANKPPNSDRSQNQTKKKPHQNLATFHVKNNQNCIKV